jgi:hypothetical protein
MINLRKSVVLLLLINPLLQSSYLFSQTVSQPVNNTGIYEFLDELAGNHIISLNSAVKPYSRKYISQCLKEAMSKREQLGTRQQKELDFYLLDFGKELNTGKNWKRRKDLFYYNDTLFSLTVNPILGGELFENSAGRATYWRNGAEARGYIGNWGFYASLRDNHEKPLLGNGNYLNKRAGGHLKGDTDWSEMQGGVTCSWNWGYAGLVKEGIQWGDNYNGANIFGGHNPSFLQLKLHISPVKWFEFNYFHGWLNSMVIDSTSSYWVTNSYGTDYREVYRRKFIAANLFTFTPARYLIISAGNSIIYDYRNINPAYLVPVFFYKSVDHSLTSGIDNMNSQMFLNISSRQIRNLHIYGVMFIDELSVSRFTKKNEWNFISYKAGLRLTDLPLRNVSFTTEFTYTYPLTFQHYVPTTTYETAGYNLGHYLKDNAREWYIAIDCHPLRTLDLNLYLVDAIRGPDYTEKGTDRVGNPPLASVEWHNTEIGVRSSYQIINDLYVWLSYTAGNIRGDSRWSPEYFYGRKNTLNAGMIFGF